MPPATSAAVRDLILERVDEQLAARGLTPSDVPPTFDLLLEGLIDSFGVVEIILMLEQRFALEFDFAELPTDDAFLGPGVIIMPNVTIGAGAVVAAGSVVTRSVAPLTMVQGNPAKPIARCGIPLGLDTPIKEFYRRLTPIAPPAD